MHRVLHDGGHGIGVRLLVSVSTAEEARAAIEGGADIIDAKNPHAGALGPVTLDTLASIRSAAPSARLLTAALGEVGHHGFGHQGSGVGPRPSGIGTATTKIESLAYAYASAGAALVKLGCAGNATAARDALASAVRGAGRAGAGVVAVAYVDAGNDAAVTLDTVVDLALAAGAQGVLVDTANKRGPGLTSLVGLDRLTRWVSQARHAELLVAVAGQLSIEDLPVVAASGADVVGVRGAACEDGRLGRVTAQRVAVLSAKLKS